MPPGVALRPGGLESDMYLAMADIMRHIDATYSEDERVDYPEIVEEFRDIGFVQVGRILGEPAPGTFEDIAAGYGPKERAAFLEHCDVPVPILRSPDGTGLVEISWFWGSPSVRIRSQLADGSAVETNRRWETQPARPESLERKQQPIAIEADMTKPSVPQRGRSIEIGATDDATAQWQQHQEHVARYAARRGVAAISLESFDQVIELWSRLFRHDAAVERRTGTVWKLLLVAYGIVSIVLGLAIAAAGARTASIVILGALVVAIPLVMRRIISIQVLPQAWRPPYV